MLYVRLHNEVIEFPTAALLAEIDGRIALLDSSGAVVAHFEKLDVLAWSHQADKVSLDLDSDHAGVSLNRPPK